MANWSFQNPDIPDGSTIENGNFLQATPDTVILAGKTLEINGGNFVNVKEDPNWTINGGNWTQLSFCSHLHPKWLAAGYIDECVENCSHVVATDEIVGGETVYTRKDTVL